MASVATAQNVAKKDTTLNRTVVVEQEYNPDINDAIKINILPAIEEPTVTKKQIQYDKSAVSNPAIPKPSMGIIVGKEEKEKPSQGYARLGYGNNNKVDAQVNYLFICRPRTDSLCMAAWTDSKKHSPAPPISTGEKTVTGKHAITVPEEVLITCINSIRLISIYRDACSRQTLTTSTR